jgi:cytochrome c
MKSLKSTLFIFFSLCITFAFAFAEGNIENGKQLFNDPNLGGSTDEQSCNTCHPDGMGLEKSGKKKGFPYFFGLRKRSLEDMVNWCIEETLNGKALNKDSQEMNDIIAYIKSLDRQ